MNVLFLQTADSTRYAPMLRVTGQTVQAYASCHGHSYNSFFGIKRGFHPWHAAYNRIEMLTSLMVEGYTGWAVYLDADSYIHGQEFDLRAYLAGKENLAFIAAPDLADPPLWWRINDGVFAINLGHPMAVRILLRWRVAFHAISDDELRRAETWAAVPSDQVLLHECLRNMPEAESACLTTRDVCGVLNYAHAAFIRQVLRAVTNDDMDKRMAIIEAAVAEAMGGAFTPLNAPATDRRQEAEDYVNTLYQLLLLREPDPEGFAHAVEQCSTPGHSWADELRAVLGSGEFRAKTQAFLAHYAQGSPNRG
ncbi:MAG: DUF4214 domain-containing protein [Acidocella sp.]|nr:DUF4214 domain-containing protein [Acidocella sp.]